MKKTTKKVFELISKANYKSAVKSGMAVTDHGMYQGEEPERLRELVNKKRNAK